MEEKQANWDRAELGLREVTPKIFRMRKSTSLLKSGSESRIYNCSMLECEQMLVSRR
jgi:hypothetical protein